MFPKNKVKAYRTVVKHVLSIAVALSNMLTVGDLCRKLGNKRPWTTRSTAAGAGVSKCFWRGSLQRIRFLARVLPQFEPILSTRYDLSTATLQEPRWNSKQPLEDTFE